MAGYAAQAAYQAKAANRPKLFLSTGYTLMLTTISNNTTVYGYPGQQIRSASDAVDVVESSAVQASDTDRVELSREARALRNVYDEKEQTIEEKYSNESRQLEREYLQEKKQLEQEFNQKKRSLGISTYV